MQDSLDAIEDKPEAFPWESGARLCLLDFTSGMDTGDGVHWPGSNMLDIVSSFGPAPERSFPGSGGIMKFPDVLGTMDTEPGNPVQCLYGRSSGTWLPVLWHARGYPH